MCIVQYEVDEDELEEPSLPVFWNSAGICKQPKLWGLGME